MPERWLAFSTVFNFRDLGGYATLSGRRVKWRTLFRADGLNRLLPEEAERIRELSIKTVVDLRTPKELEARGRFPVEAARVSYHHLPIFEVEPDWEAHGDPERPGYLADRYVEMLEEGAASVARVLHLLGLAASLPMVFHCAAGKDRTGIVAAVVLGLLGVPDDTIVADYALSHGAMARLDEYVARVSPDAARARARYPTSVVEARPDTMARFLEALRRRHGTIEAMVAGWGASAAGLTAMRANLLE